MSKTDGKPMGRMVLVEWYDAAMSLKAWEDNVDVVLCQTVGFLVKEDERQIKVAATLTADGEVGGIFALPRGFLKSIREVGVSRKPPVPLDGRKKGAK